MSLAPLNFFPVVNMNKIRIIVFVISFLTVFHGFVFLKTKNYSYYNIPGWVSRLKLKTSITQQLEVRVN